MNIKDQVSPTDNEIIDKQTPEDSSSLENQDVKDTEDSSSLGESDSNESTFDVIKKAVELDAEENDDSSEEEEKPEENEEDSADKKDEESELGDDSTGDEEKPLTDKELRSKEKTRSRFEQLQTKYRETRESLEKYEQKAQSFDKFNTFLETNSISKDEANKLFDIGALMKKDPQQALAAMTPYYNQLLQLTGNVMPNELKQQVDQGYITEQAALDLSRQKAQNEHYRNREIQQEQKRQEDSQRQQQELNFNIQSGLASLEKNWQQSDPDYKLKSTRIQDLVKLMWYDASQKGQMPRSVDEAIRMAETAKRDVERELRQFQPRKPINPVEGGGSNTARPEPKTTLDVIRQTVGG